MLTGVRREPVDRRRVRGAHKGLKRMLVEGLPAASEQPHRWKELSDAMVRQSVGDAVVELDARDAHVVKLAYFGGLSNREIADRLGLSVAAVERRLRGAVEAISAHVARGRSAGRRMAGLCVTFLCGRWVGRLAEHALPAGVAVGVAALMVVSPPPTGVTAGAAGHPAPPQRAGATGAPGSVAPGARERPAGPAGSSATTGLVAVPASPGVTVTVMVPPLPSPPLLTLPVALPPPPAVPSPPAVPLKLP